MRGQRGSPLGYRAGTEWIRFETTIDGFKKSIDSAMSNVERAAQMAARVEGYQLARKLRTEINQGAPGGREFKPLSILAGIWRSGNARKWLWKRNALRRLAIPVRYWVDKAYKKYDVYIGYQDKPIVSMQGRVSRHQLSKSWLWLAKIHQEGFSTTITNSQRHSLLRTGGELKGKGNRNQAAAVFFLHKQRQRFFTPARPIIDPFWAANKAGSPDRIRLNFEEKLRGENIFKRDPLSYFDKDIDNFWWQQ